MRQKKELHKNAAPCKIQYPMKNQDKDAVLFDNIQNQNTHIYSTASLTYPTDRFSLPYIQKLW